LAFNHPESGEPVQFESPIPDDMQQLMDALETDADAAY
jgi:23S rRNA pseudouridine1911/1915/1917 synthase